MKKKFLTFILVLMILPFQFGMVAYNYSYYGEVLHSSPGMNYATHFNSQLLGVDYRDPRDMVIHEGKIYMVATDTSDGNDMLIVMDTDFNVLDVVKEFELTTDYSDKILSKVDETLGMIDSFYTDLFEDNIIYPGTKLPMGSLDNFIGVAEQTWTTDKTNIQTNGLTANSGTEDIEVTITVDVELWDQTETYTYDAIVGTKIEGLEADFIGDQPSYKLEPTLQILDLNDKLDLEFDNSLYPTVNNLINTLKKDKSEENSDTFEYMGYEVKFNETTNEEGALVYSDIVLTELEEDEEAPEEVHGSLFQRKYSTNIASGIDVHESGIYIADTRNNRIIKMTHDYEVIDAFYDIEDETFNQIAFRPLKIAVDDSERMYVVAGNVFEGILELDFDGSFNRYTGVNPIQLTAAEVLRRALMSEAQRDKLQKFLPTDYTNVALNNKSFIFATAKARENDAENMIQLINPKGVDVLKRNGYNPPMGDVMFVEGINNYVIDGPSRLDDIAVGKHGMYTVLDSKRSRIFTYDAEGNLLYVNGDEGDQSDKFSRGVAVNYLEDDLIVLDATGNIVVYKPTEFGKTVNSAVRLHSIGEFEEAAYVWEDVLKLNTNYEIAYNGIGKYLLRKGDYKEAMKNFELGHDKYYYSKAFLNYRNEIIKENFSWIMLGVFAILVGVPVYLNRHKFKKKGRDEE